MAGIQLSGLASGFDWKSLVDQLIAVSATPKTTMQTQQTTNTTVASALNDIKSQFTAFQAQLSTDFSASSFQQRLAAPASSTSTWTASSSSGGTVGNFSFNVTALASAAQRVGKADVTGGINATSDVSGLLISSMRTAQTVTAGNFTINGTQIAVATTDTLKDVFDRISTATGGTVTAAYDSGTDAVTLTGSGALSLGSSADTSNFLAALKLFQTGGSAVSSASALGSSNLTVPLVNSGLKSAITGVDGSGNGKFTINGTDISYNINTDSIQSVMTRINSSAAGVTASYDTAADRFNLSNNTTGNVSLFASETGAGFLTAAGMIGAGSSFQSGANAEFTVNGGGSIISKSNTLDSSVTGIAGLSVTVDSTGTQSIGVTTNTADATAKINKLLDKYNAIQSSIASYTKITVKGTAVTSAPLAGNLEVQSLAAKLRSIMFSPGTGLTGSIKTLSNLGIDFAGTDTSMSVKDSALLSTKLTSYGADVGSFFNDSGSGLVTRLNAFLTSQTADTGSLAVQSANKTKQNADLDKQMAALDVQLAAERKLLESSFIAMESASSKYQSQGAQLTAAFKTSSSG